MSMRMMSTMLPLAALLAAWPVVSAPAADAEPRELAYLKDQYKRAAEQIDTEARQKKARLDEQYLKSLNTLYQTYKARNDRGSAALVEQAWAAVSPDTKPAAAETPAPAPAARLDWDKERRFVTYRYRENNFGKGAFDYSDPMCTKLLDGKTGQWESPDLVAWRWKEPSPICFEFKTLQKLKKIRLYLYGGHKNAGSSIPKSIVLYEGTKTGIGREIIRKEKMDDIEGWVEIQIDTVKPLNVLWLVINSSGEWTFLSEVEFR